MKTLLTIFCCLLLQTLSFSQKDISKNYVSKKTTKKNGKVVTVYGVNFDCSEKDEKDVEWDDIYENNINEVRESNAGTLIIRCLLYTSPSPRDATLSRMPSSA